MRNARQTPERTFVIADKIRSTGEKTSWAENGLFQRPENWYTHTIGLDSSRLNSKTVPDGSDVYDVKLLFFFFLHFNDPALLRGYNRFSGRIGRFKT